MTNSKDPAVQRDYRPGEAGIEIHLAHIQLVNPLNGNKGGSWRGRAKRAKLHRNFAFLATKAEIFGKDLSGPLVVTITRISSGTLDDDALPASAKHVRDGVADALAINDNDPRVAWRYKAEKCKRGTWGAHITIETVGDAKQDGAVVKSRRTAG